MTTERSKRPAYTTTMSLNADEIAVLGYALDSHEYWQLSSSDQRSDGVSTVEDGVKPEIDACRALAKKLDKAARRIKQEVVAT